MTSGFFVSSRFVHPPCLVRVAWEPLWLTVAPPEPFALPLPRTSAAEKVVLELRAGHARQLRHTASPPALRLASCCRPCGGCQQGGRPNAFRRCSPHTAVWDEIPGRARSSSRLHPRLSCFSARHSHQSDIWLPLCCLAMCLCARLISFDLLALTISQSAQCR